jgi:hypothetical protein
LSVSSSPKKRPAFSEAWPLSSGCYGRIVAAGGSDPEAFFRIFLIYVIPAQAGIQTATLDSRLRGNDEPQRKVLSNDSAGFRGFMPHDCWFL